MREHAEGHNTHPHDTHPHDTHAAAQRTSGHYTHGHGEAALASHATRTAANSAAYVLPHLRPGMRVLDIGCGPGTITLDLADVVAPGEVVGVDSAEAALDAARQEAAHRADASPTLAPGLVTPPGPWTSVTLENGNAPTREQNSSTIHEHETPAMPDSDPAGRVRFEVADAMNLPYDDDSFDVVHAHQVLHHLPDPVAALREMRRVCRPGGWIAVRDADYSGMAWFPLNPGLDVWRRLFCDLQRSHGAEPDAARHHRRWAREAGITDPQITSSTWTYADPDSCSWWSESQAQRYGDAHFTDQALAIGADERDLGAVVDGWRAWGADPDAWFVMVHGELLAHP